MKSFCHKTWLSFHSRSQSAHNYWDEKWYWMTSRELSSRVWELSTSQESTVILSQTSFTPEQLEAKRCQVLCKGDICKKKVSLPVVTQRCHFKCKDRQMFHQHITLSITFCKAVLERFIHITITTTFKISFSFSTRCAIASIKRTELLIFRSSWYFCARGYLFSLREQNKGRLSRSRSRRSI